jgi:Holliday junction resolvase-like predicted endonuclease
MTEKVIQRKILAQLKLLGYLVRKLDSSSSVGWPDLIAISPAGVVHFLEVKTATGRLSKMQARTINQLKENHANVSIIRGVDELDAILNAQTTGG